jgi:hypothetical protein
MKKVKHACYPSTQEAKPRQEDHEFRANLGHSQTLSQNIEREERGQREK